MTTALAPQAASGASYIGVDLSLGGIEACQVVRTARADRVRNVRLGAAGKAIEYGAVFSRIARALRRRGLEGNRIVVAAPPEKCVSAVLEMPAKNTEVPVSRLVQMELSREHRLDPAGLESAWWDIPSPLRTGGGRPVMTVGCPSSVLREIDAAAGQAGLHIVAFDSRSAALARGVCGPIATPGQWRVVCDFSSGVPCVIVATDGRVVIEHFAWESTVDGLYERVAAECRTELAVARQLCQVVPLRTATDRRAQSFAVPRVVRAVREFLDVAARGVAQCVQYHHHKYGRIDAGLSSVVVGEPWLVSRFIERQAESGETGWTAADDGFGAARGLALWHGEDPA
ncbi:MAG: hypothetical protein L6Q35_03235 [Phycisphaerales bacterium]|nr:hypothetical protein [Phycisphaerales bacterium]